MNGPVFKTTSGGGAKKAVSGPVLVELEEGEYIFREGELGTEMFIIHEGKIEILNLMNGKEVAIAVLEKGDFFGEMSVLEDLPRAASARAATDCRLLQINGTTFDARDGAAITGDERLTISALDASEIVLVDAE